MTKRKKERKPDCLERFYLAMLTLSLGLVAFLLVTLVRNVTGEEYLYKLEGSDPSDYWPVHEYVTPEGQAEYVTPDFLANPSSPNRVVEYYAPWCPHCQHFKQHYIDFARSCSKMAKDHGVAIDFYAVSCTANKELCKEQDVHSYPTVKLFPAGTKNGTKVQYTKTHCFTALKTFGVDITDEYNDKKESPIEQIQQLVKNKLTHHDARTRKQIYDDAFLSFDFAMRQSIYMLNGPLANSTAEAFSEWIEVLDSALPPTWRIHKSLTRIADDIEEVVEDEKALLAVMDETGPSHKQWSAGCPRGYTCGLWELFHIMSMGVVEWNKGASSEWGVMPVNDVADTLHSYISQFFACDVCRKHFIKEYDECAQERCTRLGSSLTDVEEWKQLPLWLWEAHNAVNVRLMHEKAVREKRTTTREDEIAVTWPSREDCPMCWHADGTWDDETIYIFLRLTYWEDDATNIQYRKDLHFEHKQKLELLAVDDDFKEENSHLSIIGIGLMLFGLLVVTIVYFLRRIEKKRTGRHKKMDYVYS